MECRLGGMKRKDGEVKKQQRILHTAPDLSPVWKREGIIHGRWL